MFITNEGTNTLEKRLTELISISRELKFLVGYFYFSGVPTLYHALRNNPSVSIKILVGLQCDRIISRGLCDPLHSGRQLSKQEILSQYLSSISEELCDRDFDRQEIYEQIHFFLDLIRHGRLHIRKTFDPNHAKLYIFKSDPKTQMRPMVFITGSSNLTRAGQISQGELNIEIGDHGHPEQAEHYFDRLWESSIPITEDPKIREQLVQLLENRTLIAQLKPFEAYMLILKTYLEVSLSSMKHVPTSELLEQQGYTDFSYQKDAAAQALGIIEANGGVIIADVTGLGKTIIACRIAYELRQRGIIICPPGLIGDENRTVGWRRYCEDFNLLDWEVRSRGDLESVAEYVKDRPDIGVVIVDEAHHFRNEKIQSYELLQRICRGRKVILLTATPFQNTPADLFALLKLFIVPGKSLLALDDDLESLFRSYRTEYQHLSHILKYHRGPNPQKRAKAEALYNRYFGGTPVDIKLVRRRTRQLSQRIKDTITPVVIRRNRLDIKGNPTYAKEVCDLPTVEPPEEIFYQLSKEQAAFYDRVISRYFGEDGKFIGAIYTPYAYQKEQVLDNDDTDPDNPDQLVRESQINLKEFMRRLAVKRFESSFAAFHRTIETFIRVGEHALKFIERTGGKFILDRAAMEKLLTTDEDTDINQLLDEYLAERKERGDVSGTIVYHIHRDFEHPQQFITDIKSDIALFRSIIREMDALCLVRDDPKLKAVAHAIPGIFKRRRAGEPERKIVLFTEYTDTLDYLAEHLSRLFPDKVLVMPPTMSDAGVHTILQNFDASYPADKQRRDKSILLASEKMAEGFNLGRAGAVINYDIPWNPTRVIQRVGRINRIGQAVFKSLYIYNCFPTEKGENHIKLREIAQQKMFMIHNALGEDARIFEPDEEVSPSRLYTAIQRNPEEMEGESPFTHVRRTYEQLARDHPEVVKRIAEGIAPMVKTAKPHDILAQVVFIRKGTTMFVRMIREQGEVEVIPFSEALPLIECEPGTPALPFSTDSWKRYHTITERMQHPVTNVPPGDISKKAFNKLNALLDNLPAGGERYRQFIEALLEDIREYKTLSHYTQQRIARIPLTPPGQCLKAIRELYGQWGDQYRSPDALKAIHIAKPEIIIAVENRPDEEASRNASDSAGPPA